MTMVLVGRGIAGIGAAGLLTVRVLFDAANKKMLIIGQIVRTILSDSSSLNTNNLQQTAMFVLYSIGFSVGPVAGGFLVPASFRWVFAIKYGILFSLNGVLMLTKIQPAKYCYCHDLVFLFTSQTGKGCPTS